MKTRTRQLLDIWAEARTRLQKQMDLISSEDLGKKLGDAPNSIGFLIRHIADVELLFGKNVFGSPDRKVIAKTVIDKKDTGEWTDLPALQRYLQEAEDALSDIISKQTEEDWEKEIHTQEFGTKTLAQAFARIVSHTAYHAGQIAILQKYGHA
jgi:uncharacterized damage-inducible protein DinB